MEFKDLPDDIQRIACQCMAGALKDFGTEIKSEPAKELARNIKAAFVALYSEDSAKQDSEESAAIAQAIAHYIAGTEALRKLYPGLTLKGSRFLDKEPVAGSGLMSQANGSSAAYSSNAQTKI